MSITNQRILGLDLLKILTLVAIAIFHANEFVFFSDEFPLGWSSPILKTFFYYARLFGIGGQVLVSIIYFLFGYTKKSRHQLLKISFFSILGQVLLGIAFKTIEWDIYSYIFSVNILIIIFPFFYSYNFYSLIFSLCVLLISPNTFQSFFEPTSFLALLTGNFNQSSSGSWPLLPWAFLAILFYQLGILARESNKFLFWQKNEIFFWIFALVISLPGLGHYYNLPIGPNFYHFAFYQSSYIFFSNFIPFLFLGRISLLNGTQEFLANKNLPNFIYQTYWNQHLGLTYLCSILYLGIGINLKNLFFEHPFTFDLFFLGIMPISEGIARLIVLSKKKVFNL